MDPSLDTVNVDNTSSKTTYKVCILNAAGKPVKIIAFLGNNQPLTPDSKLFSSDERLLIQNERPELISSNYQIHPDDTISIIKKKILTEIGMNVVGYDELYLFAKHTEPLDLKRLYRMVSQNETRAITKRDIGQLIANLEILDENIRKYFHEHTGEITYKDLSLGFGNRLHALETYVSLGQRLIKSRDLLFSANPYRLLSSVPPVFQLTQDNPMVAFENQLLLSYGKIVNNTIFVSLAADMFDYASKKTIDSAYMVELYLPFLRKRSIYDKIQLLESRPQMIMDTKEMITKYTLNMFKAIDIFYDVWANKNSAISYRKNGIYSFDLTLHPATTTNTPLEYIFKQIHASEQIPYIKYNPGFRREEIYKLYSVQRTKTGKKIPFLKRNVIMNLSKQTGKKGGLSLITYYKLDQRMLMIVIDFARNGDINVQTDCKDIQEKYKDNPLTPITVKNLEDILLFAVNPIIKTVNRVLESSGYAIISFQGLDDELLEYNTIQYGCDMQLKQTIQSSDIHTLLSGMFNVIESDIGVNKDPAVVETATLRFKRVDNYKEMDAVNALITETYKRTNNIPDIVQALETNFQMTDENARIKITEYLNNHILLNGKYVNKTIDIAENPGFLCNMQVRPLDNKLEIKVSDINSIYYVEVLQIYIDSFLRITQYPSTCAGQKNTLNELLTSARPVKPSVQIENVIVANIPQVQPIQFGDLKMGSDEDMEESDEESGLFFEDEDEDEEDVGDIMEEESPDDDGKLLIDNDDDDAQPESVSEPSAVEQIPEEEEEELGSFFKMNGGSKVFFKKMKELEPTLFRTKKEGQYDSYARLCQSSSNRQPVILTDEEKQKIDKENPGSYEIAMKYGTNPEKPNWYICPRYWCLQTGMPMTEKQVEKQECGGKVIPQHANKPSPGHYIYEFTDSREHTNADGSYRWHRPGFLPKDSHPTHCLPCCFKELNTEQQIKRRKACNITRADFSGESDKLNEILPSDETTTRKDRIQITILSYDRKILDQHRWGFLPLSVELFLHTDNSKSTSDKNPTVIRDGEQPLLRYGVEYSHNQSFIACLADIYTYTHDIAIPTIKEMKDILIQHMSIDSFIKSHNGSLVSNFRPRKMFVDDMMVEKYKTSEFYQGIPNKDDYAQHRFLTDTIASYENFIKFLLDNDSIIDHTYLWDLITCPHTKLFDGGINLVIMEMLENDNTDNISLVCPTNSYLNTLYDSSKETVILLKRENFYEPVYLYGNTKARKAYSTQDAIKIFNKGTIPKELVRVIKMIESVSNKYCKATTYKTAKVYEYAQNMPAMEIYHMLISKNFIVSQQIVNYQGKVIGLSVLLREEDTRSVYVPTMPSGLIRQLKRVFVDEIEWLPYETTRDLLNSIYYKTSQRVLCKPVNKVVEDGLIVGILTQTNQFIQVSDTVENLIEDGIDAVHLSGYKGKGYYIADKKLETSDHGDQLRIKTIRNISLESQFYIAFRNKIRLLLNDYMFKEVRESLVSVLDNGMYLYNVKLQKVIILLKYLLSKTVSFVEISEDIFDTMENLKTFVNSETVRAICLAKNQDNLCMPVNNLISGEKNENVYYARAADELIRYNRIRMFMLDPDQYLNISSSEQVVYDNEVILLQSTINSGYFDNMEPFETNKYVKNVDHNFANPMNSENKIQSEIKIADQYQGI